MDERYPDILRRAALEGTTVVTMMVDVEGRPDDIEVKEGSGLPDLDDVAEEIAEEMRFEPAMRNGRPVELEIDVPLRFRVWSPYASPINEEELDARRRTIFHHRNMGASGRHGSVALAILVDEEGQVRNVKFRAGSGDPELDRIAFEVAWRGRYEPQVVGGPHAAPGSAGSLASVTSRRRIRKW